MLIDSKQNFSWIYKVIYNLYDNLHRFWIETIEDLVQSNKALPFCVKIEPGNWSRSGRTALVVTGNRSGYPTRNPPEMSRWFGYISGHEGWPGTGRATRPFSGCFLGGFLVTLKFHLIFWQILTKNSCIGPHTESYMSHL